MPTFNTTNPKPGYVYNSSDDTWYPLLGLATQSLDGLTDVVITTPTSGQILAYDGTQWINQTETGDVSAVTSGTGISVTNGTGPIPSVAVDTAVVATTNNTLTLSNKTISGTSNTITNVSLTTGVTGTLPVANGGTGITSFGTGIATFLGTPSSANLAAALTDETGSGANVFGTSPTITTAVLNQPIMVSPEERVNVVASAATGTVALDALTAGTMLYTSNATGNWTLNVRGSASTSLNSILTTGDSITVVFLNTNGSTAYYPTAFQIDGSAVTPKWQGGTAPAAGNASSIDAYVYNIIKTASATFTVLASQTKFA